MKRNDDFDVFYKGKGGDYYKFRFDNIWHYMGTNFALGAASGVLELCFNVFKICFIILFFGIKFICVLPIDICSRILGYGGLGRSWYLWADANENIEKEGYDPTWGGTINPYTGEYVGDLRRIIPNFQYEEDKFEDEDEDYDYEDYDYEMEDQEEETDEAPPPNTLPIKRRKNRRKNNDKE